VTQAGFIDSWEMLHPEDTGLTYSNSNAYVKNESENGGRRIDYVFSRDGAEVERCKIVGNVPDDEGEFPSDHFGLFADVLLGNGR
jgi:exonuclease III